MTLAGKHEEGTYHLVTTRDPYGHGRDPRLWTDLRSKIRLTSLTLSTLWFFLSLGEGLRTLVFPHLLSGSD